MDEFPNSWGSMAAQVELRRLVKQVRISDVDRRSRVRTVRNLFNLIYKGWDGRGDFGEFAARAMYALTQDPQTLGKFESLFKGFGL